MASEIREILQKDEQVTDVFFDDQRVVVHWRGDDAPSPQEFNRQLVPLEVTLGALRPAPESLF